MKLSIWYFRDVLQISLHSIHSYFYVTAVPEHNVIYINEMKYLKIPKMFC